MQSRARIFVAVVCITLLVIVVGAPGSPGMAQGGTPTRRAGLPTNTPRGTTPTGAVVVVPFEVKLCADCTRVRLRASPGTAGEVVTFLSQQIKIEVIARSDDGAWLQVIVVANNASGWVAAELLRLSNGQPIPREIIFALPVAGVAVEAPPTPTSTSGIPSFMSGVTFKSRQIFLAGQKLGNRANVFVRVGDSITISPNFLYDIGIGKVDLLSYGGLGGVIEFYRAGTARNGNSFVTTPIAAGAGWATEQLLTRGYSFPEVCGDDNPLVCEYRLTKPAVALILIGTNDSGSGTTDQFGANLRLIVETSIQMGVIPVLSTIPPKTMNDEQAQRAIAFNKVIRQTAQLYEVPLWDYYFSMEKLPNKGMDSDGLHPSVPPDGRVYRFSPENLQYGYTLRNLQALQVLDTLYRLVLY